VVVVVVVVVTTYLQMERVQFQITAIFYHLSMYALAQHANFGAKLQFNFRAFEYNIDYTVRRSNGTGRLRYRSVGPVSYTRKGIVVQFCSEDDIVYHAMKMSPSA
jgi:hypothetical protein